MSKYSLLCETVTDVVQHCFVRVQPSYSNTSILPCVAIVSATSAGTFTSDTFSSVEDSYIIACVGGERCGRFHAFWLG